MNESLSFEVESLISPLISNAIVEPPFNLNKFTDRIRKSELPSFLFVNSNLRLASGFVLVHVEKSGSLILRREGSCKVIVELGGNSFLVISMNLRSVMLLGTRDSETTLA